MFSKQMISYKEVVPARFLKSRVNRKNDFGKLFDWRRNNSDYARPAAVEGSAR